MFTNFPKVTIIVRGYTYEQVRLIACILAESKINSIEIALNSPDAINTIKRIADEFGEDLFVGAGTVLNLDDAKKAIDAGAKFLLSPIVFSEEICEYAKDQGVVTVSGACSPTEIYRSIQNGSNIVKVFPAARLGSKYISDVLAPFGEVPIMAVGGINEENVNEFISAGAKYVGLGSGILNREHILNNRKTELKNAIRRLQKKLIG